MTKSNDILSWDLFWEASKSRTEFPPKTFSLYDRLIASTENFFAVPGLGGFRSGYLLLITKELLPAFAFVNNKHLEELRWFIYILTTSIEETYKCKVTVFEHGMCACMGGLDRAHLHIMSYDPNISSDYMKKAINETLTSRKAGIKSVTYRNYQLQNIFDIQQVLDRADPKEYSIVGRQLLFDDLNDKHFIEEYPSSLLSHVTSGGQYIYFNTKSPESSFLTTLDIQTQLGREVIYRAELEYNEELARFEKNALRKNPHAQVWRWQEFDFVDNILTTMGDMYPSLKEIENETQARSFKYRTHGMGIR